MRTVEYLVYILLPAGLGILFFCMSLPKILESRNQRLVEVEKEKTKQEEFRLERAKIESSANR